MLGIGTYNEEAGCRFVCEVLSVDLCGLAKGTDVAVRVFYADREAKYKVVGEKPQYYR